MADNYLERQRELYEIRKAAWEKTKKYGKRKPPMKKRENEKTSEPIDKGTGK